MPDSKETKKVKVGDQTTEVVKGDMPESDWAKIVADQVKNTVENLPVFGQLIQAGKTISEATKLAGAGVRAAQGQGFDPNSPEANAGTVLDAASNLVSAGVGAGKQVIGNLVNSPEMVASGKAQAEKNLADVTTPIERRDVPPPPAYPGPEPEAAQETPPPPPQYPGAEPPLSSAPKAPSFDHAKQSEIDKAYGALKASSEIAKGAVQAQADVAKTNLQEEDKLARDAELLNLQRAQEQARIMEIAQKTRQEWSDRQNQLMDQARQAASNPVDPNRYWNNKDVGQKVGAVIAGALFGFSGQGMQWLQRLDALVAQDMKAQESDRASRVGGLQSSAAQAGLAAKEAMAMGADAAEAANLERMAKLQNVKSRLEMLAKGTQNAEVQARAANMMAQIDERTLDAAQKNEHLKEAAANNRAQRYLEQQKMMLMASQAGAKMAGGRPMEEGQRKALSEVLNVSSALKDMWGDYTRMAGQTGSSVKSLVPTTDANIWKKRVSNEYTQMIGKPLEGGVLKEEDYKRYHESYIPAAGDTEKEAKAKVDTLIKHAVAKYENEVRSMQAGGYDTSRLPPVEAFEADLRAKTFGGGESAPPGFTEVK